MGMEDSWRDDLTTDTMALWLSMPNEGDENSRNFRCSRCGKQYLRKRTLRRHMRYDCGTEPRFSCPLCGLRVRRRYALTSHLVAVHGVQRDQAEYSVPSLFGFIRMLQGDVSRGPWDAVVGGEMLCGGGELGEGLNQCSGCKKLYSSKGALRRHMRYECGVEPRFKCNLCSRRFTHNFNLKSHLIWHVKRSSVEYSNVNVV
ncbi:hypothetical protein ANN_25162 [Periplaneta americana]|uniref:C2H2-type domain-containing protein n=1 Tax=Periplaneta americana TaxID=6978 RepID=A0ABQ8S0K1_PERAM|nr:hypothetical protein ANN_25162 [Periplaneta americana]